MHMGIGVHKDMQEKLTTSINGGLLRVVRL